MVHISFPKLGFDDGHLIFVMFTNGLVPNEFNPRPEHAQQVETLDLPIKTGTGVVLCEHTHSPDLLQFQTRTIWYGSNMNIALYSTSCIQHKNNW